MRCRRPTSTSELLDSTVNLPLHRLRNSRKRGRSHEHERRGAARRNGTEIEKQRPEDDIRISSTATANVWIAIAAGFASTVRSPVLDDRGIPRVSQITRRSAGAENSGGHHV